MQDAAAQAGDLLGDRIRRNPSGMLRWLRLTPLTILTSQEFAEQLSLATTGSTGNPITELLYQSQDERLPPNIQAYFVEAAAVAAENPRIAGEIYTRAFDNVSYNRVGLPGEVDLVTGVPMDIAAELDNAPPRPAGWTEGDAIALVQTGDDGNVRITGAPPPQYPCLIGPYGSMRRRCSPRQAHHIIPEYTKKSAPGVRIGGIPPMPTQPQGLAICMMGNGGSASTQHGIAQRATRSMTEGFAAASIPPGVITARQAMLAGAAGVIAARPECAVVVVAAVNAEFAGIRGGRLMNGLYNPRFLTPAARAAIIAGQ